ncbi:MAG TPA: hypothetical protein VFU92_06870 [Usitatibacter sp.]|jgi:hypothetical protein|nr:hypothetical protein [Usitatibacter sp.]
MANSRNDAAKPMPFPGESPTVSLAMAAGRMYAPKPEDEKPARAGKKGASAKKPVRRASQAKKSLKRRSTRSRAK